MTPDDIAKSLPDDDDKFGGTRVIRTIPHNRTFSVHDLQSLFSEMKQDHQLYAYALSGWEYGGDEDRVVVYRSDSGELSHEEIVQDIREYLGIG